MGFSEIRFIIYLYICIVLFCTNNDFIGNE